MVMRLWRRTLLLLCLLVFAQPASSQTPSSIPSMGDRPGFMWVIRPTTMPVDIFYPVPANEQSVAGRVALACTPRADQRMDCQVASETPTGWGFGQAALGMSHSFRVEPNMRDGHVIGTPHGAVNLAFSPFPSGAATGARLDLPLWEAAPNAEAVQAAWLEGKNHPGARGRAVLSCTVDAERALDCQAVRESEAGLGLGRAAMALASQFRVSASEQDFLTRHSTTPFLLPVNFGLAARYEPLNRFTAGDTPIVIPSPPPTMIRAIYPQGALAAHQSGEATVTCTLRTSGPATCAITSETPSGAGFGNVTLSLANTLFMNLALVPGVWEESLPGDQFVLRLVFDADAVPPATAH